MTTNDKKAPKSAPKPPRPNDKHDARAHARAPHTAPSDTPRLAADAYAAILPEIEALPASSVRPITVDIPRAVSIALGASPAIAALRPAIVEELPDFDTSAVDGLDRYALGAWYAHLLALPTTGDASTLRRLLDEAAPLREGLLVAAEALAHRTLLDPKTVAEIRSGQGNLDTANDLVALSSLFTMRWADVESNTAVTRDEVDRAAVLGPELLAALGERGQASRPPLPSGAADRRARAFTLLVDAYDACRRAATYLRWAEGDADVIAPSLFKKPRRAAAEAPAPDEPPPPAPEPTGAAPAALEPAPA
ncbi:MAG TPA: hypothetical protein VHB21_27865 [Minicystis sp.]|nr:hypothetical protein [Minicystis sp.]